MIKSVHLINWKSHLDSKLDFSPGVNALIGINGAGKSSVLDAVSFALFGTFPSLKTRRLSLEDLIMKKPDKKDHCVVELVFSAGGSEYSVKRSVERGSSSSKAEIRKNGEMHESGAELVTAEVVRALQMDYDLFSKAVYSEQNGMDYFLRVQKGRRMDEIDRMLKVDRFEDVRSGAVSIVNRIKAASQERVRLMADMEREDYGAKLESVMSDVAQISADAERIRTELESVSKLKATADEELRLLEKTEIEFNEARYKLESIRSSLAEAVESLERRRKRLEGRDIVSIGAEKSVLENDIKKMRSWSVELNESLQEKRGMVAEINGRIRIEMESANSLDKLGAKCPLCESEISDEKKKSLSSSHRDHAAKMRAEYAKFAEDASKISEELETLMEKIPAKEREFAKTTALLSDVDEIAALEKRVKDYEKQNSIANERLTSLASKYDREKISTKRVELRKHVELEASLLSEHRGLSNRMRDKMDVVNEMKNRMALLERYRKDSERSAEAIDGMTRFVSVLKTTQEQLRSEFLKNVNLILGDVWKLLYPYGDFIGIRIAVEDDYSLELQEPGGWVGVESVSGGERSIAALALRIAFSRAFLPNLKWLILDEPTHNLDANAIGQLSEILRDKISVFAEQVFIITHEDRISEGVTGNIYRLERDKENESVTKAVAI